MKHFIQYVGCVGRDEDGQLVRTKQDFIVNDGLSYAPSQAGFQLIMAKRLLIAEKIKQACDTAFLAGAWNFSPLWCEQYKSLFTGTAPASFPEMTDEIKPAYIGFNGVKGKYTIWRRKRYSKIRFANPQAVGQAFYDALSSEVQVAYRQSGTQGALWEAPTGFYVGG